MNFSAGWRVVEDVEPFDLHRLLRGLTAAGVLASADVHLVLWAEGFSSIPAIGPMFMLNAVAGLVVGLAVVVWEHPLPVFLAAGFAALTLLAFILSVTVGLFGFRETLAGAQQFIAGVAEIVSLVCGVAILVGEGRPAASAVARRVSTARSRSGLVRR